MSISRSSAWMSLFAGILLFSGGCGGPDAPDDPLCTPVDDGNQCTEDRCDLGVPVNVDRLPGTACSQSGGTACDGLGNCVDRCADYAPDGDETDVDCGGLTCGACADGQGCLVGADCQSLVCAGAGPAANTCAAPSCNDGATQAGEQCDDGNGVDGDGCDNNCTPTACGNGVITVGETCDDGNPASGDGCDNNCTPTACGNGVISVGEQCDDGNTTNGDGCSATCQVE